MYLLYKKHGKYAPSTEYCIDDDELYWKTYFWYHKHKVAGKTTPTHRVHGPEQVQHAHNLMFVNLIRQHYGAAWLDYEIPEHTDFTPTEKRLFIMSNLHRLMMRHRYSEGISSTRDTSPTNTRNHEPDTNDTTDISDTPDMSGIPGSSGILEITDTKIESAAKKSMHVTCASSFQISHTNIPKTNKFTENKKEYQSHDKKDVRVICDGCIPVDECHLLDSLLLIIPKSDKPERRNNRYKFDNLPALHKNDSPVAYMIKLSRSNASKQFYPLLECSGNKNNSCIEQSDVLALMLHYTF